NTKAMFESMNIIEVGLVDIAVHKECANFIQRMRAANLEVQKAITANDVFELVEANHEFHMNFARCSQNEFLIRAAQDIRTEAKRLSYLSYDNIIDPQKPITAHYESVVQEHELIIRALDKKDGQDLKKLMEDHIRTFRQRIIVFMTS
ncbi:MAG: FCD domain-containing protein, partial [Proteobacteria bacterium]|nr:FCD domain-containing protein [Pseudomonadota bacterium]